MMLDHPPTPTTMTPPPDWSEPCSSGPLPFWSCVRQDLDAHVAPEARVGRPLGRWLKTAVRSAGFHVMFLHRVAHQCYYRLGLPGRILAGCIFWWLRHVYTCSIAATSRLYGGLILPHPQGIVIGHGAVVGPASFVFHNVTLGGSPGKIGLPRVGRAARIYTGAVLVGPIVVGDNVMVGALTLVAHNLPSRVFVHVPPPIVDPLPERYLSRPEDFL